MEEVASGIAAAPQGETQEQAVNDAPEQATGEVEQKTTEEKVPEWAKRRFGELTAKRHEAEKKANDALEYARQIEAQLKAAKTNQNSEQPQFQGDLNQIAELRARQIADEQLRTQSFNQRCNLVAEEGKKEFADFEKSLENLNQYFGLSKEFLEVVVDIDNPHKVLHYLGKPENLDQFERISKMPPTKQAIELAKLSGSVNKALQKPVSKAPEPINALSGSGSSDGVPDPSNPKDWIKWRNENARKKR